MNDVTGTITFLTLLASTGILGASFVFQVSKTDIANEAIDLIFAAFMQQYREAVQARQTSREEAQARGATVVGGLENVLEQILKPFYAITGGIDMPDLQRP
jgi:hypothetical protein